MDYAVQHLVPRHLQEVKSRKEELVDKTIAAVKERLTVEINYWDHRAEQLKQQELAGRINARINSAKARQRADELASRLQRRMEELRQERQVSPLPPNVIGGAMIIPIGLLHGTQASRLQEEDAGKMPALHDFARETRRVEQAAMAAVMAAERELGFEPRDVSADKCGYDIESRIPDDMRAGRPRSCGLRFIEVKGRIKGAQTVTITKNEILTALNKPEQYILAIVEVDLSASAQAGGDRPTPCYIRQSFTREPEFGVTSVNYKLEDLLTRGGPPQ